jgi:predicted choloylglycine hydrolase
MAFRTQMDFRFRAFSEDKVGALWQQEFEQRWPAYHQWFLRYGESDRPTYFDSLKALQTYMPELIPVYEDMVELAGGGDHAARFLSQYSPPPLFRGCSQAVYLKDEPIIVRNYDYSPYVFDGLVMRSHFDQVPVIAMIDCMSGVLDGMNQHGLAVSMSFGGLEDFGEGFGITIVLRYILEYASNVREAVELVKDIPVHGAYNVTLLDKQANFSTLAMAPGEKTREVSTPVATNHQNLGSWPLYEEKVKTKARFDYLNELIEIEQETTDSFVLKFLQPPLYHTQFGRGFGTLYTAAYYPYRNECRYIWPANEWRFNFDNFQETVYQASFIDPAGYPNQTEPYADVHTANRIPVLQF